MKTAEEMLQENAREIIYVTADATLHEALQKMVIHNIGAIFIKEDDQIIGVWTERDLMRNMLSPSFNPQHEIISKYMTTGLLSAPHTDTTEDLMDKFLGMRLRHLLIEKDGEFIGMLSSGDVMKASLIEKTKEYEELNFHVSWEYYENWRANINSNKK